MTQRTHETINPPVDTSDALFDIGAMIKVRGRDWVILPESSQEFLRLKPLGGNDSEIAGIYVGGDAGEEFHSSAFPPPNPQHFGDARSAALLIQAAKLAIRSGAGPFRSLGRLAVEPRPYQLVPLLMALRQSPARLLIADDVGIGKTIEAALIARELIDRGEIQRMAVLCPPHLAEQWAHELRQKFGIDAKAVLPSTVKRLERDCDPGQSIFERYKFVVVSLDLVKTDRWRNEFVSNAPELLIVDEAHTCAEDDSKRGKKRHQRYRLLEELAKDSERHLILVTATPHSGKETAFSSLLKLLNPDFADLSLDLSGAQNEKVRIKLARHLVQRGRQDIRAYLNTETPFPEREDATLEYKLHPEYAELFQDVLNYAKESVQVPGEAQHHTRLRWWAAIGLLRTLASSPEAAALSLRQRALNADSDDIDVIDSMGRDLVFDPDAEEHDFQDSAPGVQLDTSDPNHHPTKNQQLDAFANRAEALAGKKDHKLKLLIKQVKELLDANLAPIVFCRFIATAEAVAKHLQATLKGVEVQAVTSKLTPAERLEQVDELGKHDQRVLVATDCLSEGINLQTYFSAVVHYDLPWNPTRLDQREGRVDRYGQFSPKVRVLTLYGDNQIDKLILKVLVDKHRLIRATLGTSIPAPEEAESLLDLLLHEVLDAKQDNMPILLTAEQELEAKWKNAADKEKKSRSRFAQHSIRTDEVASELDAVKLAIGDQHTTQQFVLSALKGGGVTVSESNGTFSADPAQLELGPEYQDFLKEASRFRFQDRASNHNLQKNTVPLARNHPLVEALASTILGQALDQPETALAKRVGVIRTSKVNKLTTLLLLRHRFHLNGRKGNHKWQTLAEELDLVAFRGRGEQRQWLPNEEAYQLLEVEPEGNIDAQDKTERLSKAIAELTDLQDWLLERAKERGEELYQAHERVRGQNKGLGATYGVDPPGPPDLLGIYLYLPVPKLGGLK